MPPVLIIKYHKLVVYVWYSTACSNKIIDT